jgi:LytR_cpsA_psr family/LytR cell envelope-related transcriptional attenuator
VTGKRRRGRDEVPEPASEAPESPAPERPALARPAPPPVETVTLPPLTRRQLRIDRRKRRRKVGAVGVAAVAVLALVIIAAIAFGVHKAVTNNHHTVAQSQTTVLLQIQGPDREALGSVLLAHDPSGGGSGVELLVPSQLITDVCGVGQVTFGQTLAAANGEQVSRQAVSAALGGITIDGSWVLSTTLFAKLVDAVGGVVVDVDTNVLSPGPDGASVLDIPQGTDERLTGAKAVEYATYRASANEDAASQLARLSDVVDATIRALPHTTAGVTQVLGQLGPGGASSLGAEPLSALLVGLAADDSRPGGVLPIGLPTTLIDSGGAPAYSVDTAKTTQLVEQSFKPSLPAVRPGRKITVELRNGVGSPGLVATACPRLAAAGLVYAGQGNAATFSNAPSEVQIGSDSATDRDDGAKVAHALRLPAGDVRLSALGQDQADVVVVLGRDYRP